MPFIRRFPLAIALVSMLSKLSLHRAVSIALLSIALLSAMCVVAAGAAAACLVSADVGDERYNMVERADSPQTYRVTQQLAATGTKRAVAGAADAKNLQLEVNARFAFAERRLPGLGVDAQSLRSIRYYERARAELQVDSKPTSIKLTEPHRLIVSAGRREGMLAFCPAGPMQPQELNLLQVPGDSLAILGLLPTESVSVGEPWKPADWVLPLLAGTEAVEKTALECKIANVAAGIATVEFTGEVTGASLGAAAVKTVTGTFQFHLADQYIKRLELKQVERAAVGVVSTGLDVTATMVVEREPISTPESLSEAGLKGLTLEPQPELLLLGFELPEWGLRFVHERTWHVMQTSSEFSFLRLMDAGELIAQLNIQPLPAAAPGKRMEDEKFRAAVRQAIGKNFEKIVSSEAFEIPGVSGKDPSVPKMYRVMATGQTAQGPVAWIYYLVAASDGRQFVFVFTVSGQHVEALAGRDASVMGTVETPAAATPTAPAAASKPAVNRGKE